MGNRAVITTRDDFDNDGIGVYLHWNGGMDSVRAFLEYCRLRGFRSPDTDCYGYAQLCRVIGNFFGGGLSLGVDKVSRLDTNNYDNGTYIVKDWRIVGREYFKGPEQNEYDLAEMLMAIDEAQPEKERLGKEFLLSVRKKREDLKPGDIVFATTWKEGEYKKVRVKKICGEKKIVNGTDVEGLPFVELFVGGLLDPEDNVNNYLRDEEYYVSGQTQM